MKYLSVDIETTGLDPDCDQILEIAAVVEDTEKYKNDAISTLPRYQSRISYLHIHGQPYALAMNSQILYAIARGENTKRADVVGTDLRLFIYRHFGPNKVVAAGKNFASFDRQFLKRAFPEIEKLFHHRSIDPAMLYLKPDDTVPPSTTECLTRANYDPSVTHDALDDARQVISLIRASRVFA